MSAQTGEAEALGHHALPCKSCISVDQERKYGGALLVLPLILLGASLPQHHWINDFWEGRATGRLLCHDPTTGETRVVLDNLLFANGVALGPDEAFVLVNETLAARIVRYWLKGPKAGTDELFIGGLPGYCDNLSFNGDGIFWVAIPAPRSDLLEQLAGSPFLRQLIFRLPERLKSAIQEKTGWIIGLDANGQVKYNLRETSGTYSTITSVNEFDCRLYLGSIEMRSVGRVKRPQ